MVANWLLDVTSSRGTGLTTEFIYWQRCKTVIKLPNVEQTAHQQHERKKIKFLIENFSIWGPVIRDRMPKI